MVGKTGASRRGNTSAMSGNHNYWSKASVAGLVTLL